MRIFQTIEHRSFSVEELESIKELNLNFSCNEGEVKYIGLNPNLQTSYFIGIDWLKVNHSIIQVNPKIKNLDFMSMFLECLNSPNLNKEISRIYKIDLDNPKVEIDSIPFEITPMLIIHFLSVMRNLASKGLKRNFIRVEENLQSKVKGKIKFSQHFKYNISKGRFDKNYCNYQEYSVDCLENQLLKKTLQFCGSYLSKYYKKKEALSTFNYCISAFDLVSDDIDAIMVKKVRINPVYKEYAQALKLAKLILRRFGYSISQTTQLAKTTPPFWIDMSLLFEIYVYGKLKKEFGSVIKYQQKGKYGNTDFLKLDEKIVIDTKYKLLYNDPFYEIENIRQISGYARDVNIRKKLNAGENELLPCCIIYPDPNSPTDFHNRSILDIKIDQFEKFWKIGIRLPVLPPTRI